MIEISLWGNATDLSLLANLRFEDLEKLQGKKAIETQQKNIVVNDMEEVWKYFSTLQGAQIDIVLDNAGVLFHKSTLMLGFELFVDVFLAVYFLEIGAAKTIICHLKDFGWFVSDVISADFDCLFELLEDESIADTPQQRENIRHLRDRWHQFYKSGKIQIRSDPFWTTAHPFWRMPSFAPQLYKALQKSDLVVYKGDLNYRKLIEDVFLAFSRLISGVVA
jgi:damage-control phosphatase, subfamily III